LIRILPFFTFWKHFFLKQQFIRVLIVVILLFSASYPLVAQNISGQWIGKFTSEEDPRGGGTDYVLEIESKEGQLTGFSYTYFSIAGKRYFVICKLKGNYDKSSKSMSINEVETIKTNTPPDFENCHQLHQLTYLKQKDKETLVGKWKPSEKGSNCGKGFTELERKALVKENSNKKVQNTQKTTAQNQNPAKKEIVKPPIKTSPSANDKNASTKNNQNTPKPTTPSQKNIVKNNKPTPEIKKVIVEEPKVTKPPTTTQQSVKDNYEQKKSDKSVLPNDSLKVKKNLDNSKEKMNKRTYEIIKVIEVSQPSIKIEIYDNGQIDGDIVSIYLNEKQLVASKMLTAQPISLQIEIDEKEAVYDLIMFAESLGSIPPNTALMIVTTPTQRYEINISSNEQTSGAIRFKIKK
jgi:hypothetical protein